MCTCGDSPVYLDGCPVHRRLSGQFNVPQRPWALEFHVQGSTTFYTTRAQPGLVEGAPVTDGDRPVGRVLRAMPGGMVEVLIGPTDELPPIYPGVELLERAFDPRTGEERRAYQLASRPRPKRHGPVLPPAYTGNIELDGRIYLSTFNPKAGRTWEGEVRMLSEGIQVARRWERARLATRLRDLAQQARTGLGQAVAVRMIEVLVDELEGTG